MPKKILTNQEIEFARLLQKGTEHADIAKALNIHIHTVANWARKPEIIAWREKVVAKAIDISGITEAAIISQYWKIATLSPDETRGNVAGQVKALDSLSERLGLTVKTEAKAATPEAPAKPNVFRSAWLGKPSGDSLQ